MMENWLWQPKLSKEQINELLSSHLYTAVNSLEEHAFCPTRIISTEKDQTVFETMEIVSSLDPSKQWIVSLYNNQNGLDIIYQISKNKQDLLNISTCLVVFDVFASDRKKIESEIQLIINSILYGVDYIFFPKNYMDKLINKIYNFISKYSYKTKIMVSNLVYMDMFIYTDETCFDGVVWTKGDILSHDIE